MSATFDATTTAEYAAATTAAARSAVIVAALTGTISVKVFDGSNVEKGSGTMASPWATASGDTVTVGEVTSFTVGATGTPDANWYIRFQNAGATRWVRGSFGLSTSAQDFTWSLDNWTATHTGTIGTATITTVGNSAPAFTVAPTNASIASTGGTVQFTAVDPEGSTVTYSLTTTRSGITISPTTGLVTVAASAAGTNGSIVVQASDGILTASTTCAVIVSETDSQWPTQGAITYTPIIRNGRGPGMNTPAGSGRTLGVTHAAGTTVTASRILRVNSLSSANSGSGDAGTWRYCIARHQSLGGPSTIVFDVGGTIDLQGISSTCRGNLLTVAGESAPSPGIQIINATTFEFYGSDICVRHLTLRPRGSTNVNTNAIYFKADATSGSSYRLVADHLTTMWGPDQVFSTYVDNNVVSTGVVEDLTVSNCIIAEGIGIATDATHQYGSLMGDNQGPWLAYGNLWAHQRDRSPLSRANRFAMVNNLVYNWGNAATQLASQNRGPYNAVATSASLVSNVYVKGADTSNGTVVQNTTSSTRPLVSGSKIYLSGNKRYTVTGVDDTPAAQSGLVSSAISPYLVGTADYWPTGLVAADVSTVRTIVQSFAGSRPAERDTQTARLITEASGNTGRLKVVGTVSHATYSPSDVSAQNRWAAPSGGGTWNTIDATGYTKLETYLHQLEDAVL